MLPGENAVFGPNGAGHDTGKMRHHGHFVVEDVAALFADDFLSGASMQFDGDLVAHGAAGDKECGFAAENGGGTTLQAVDGRVFGVNVVADFGLEHGTPHRG